MTMTRGAACILVTLVASWLTVACWGAEPVPALSGPMVVAGVRIDVRSDGRFSVRRGDRVLVRDANLVLAGEGWRGTAGQSSMKAAEGYPRRDGAAHVFRGTVVEPVAGVTWTLDQRIEPVAGGVKVVYTATPERDCEISEACVFMDLPVAEWSGKPVVLWPSAEGVFPAQAPQRRHFLSGATRRAALGAMGSERLGLAFDAAVLCTVQDGRESGSDCYQIYPRLSAGRQVRAGTAYRLGMTLIPGDPTPLAVPRLALECRDRPRLEGILAGPDRVPQFTRFEVAFQAGGVWTNPYDPDQVVIDAVIHTPEGRVVEVPAFFFQDYERDDLSGAEMLIPKGPSGWRMRFAPASPGVYRWALRLRNAGQTVTSPERTFTAVAAPGHHGHLRVSRRNPHYFEFDDGTSFFGIGMNIATLDAGRLASADRWYSRFAGAGGNLVRSWWCAAGTDVESEAGSRPDTGAGRYRQEDCWRIDYLMTLCERLGLHVMCCIETQQALRRDAWWNTFTYNRANGGPLDAPAQFFTDENARRLFRNRLRYLVARWSYSTSVYAWQFWNEVSACNDYRAEPVAAWHREMATYLRSIDPAAHIIHTNFGNLDGYREVDGLPEMEAVSANTYSRRDMAQTGIWGTRYMTSRYRKPFLLTEYGVGHHGGWVPEDPTGIIVHNGLWGPLMSGSAGTGMPWGWNDWIDRQDMYRYWKPVADLVAGVPFAHREWRPLQVKRFTFPGKDRAPSHADVFVEGWPRNYGFTLCPTQRPEVFEIDADGELRDEESLSAVLRGGERRTLGATFPVDGALVVHVPEISESGAPVLRVEVDGKPALTQPLPRGEGKPWAYWRAFPVPVSAGTHRLAISNSGSGALWTAFELQRFRRREGPDLDVAGQSCDDTILLWLRNPQFIWLYQREGRQPIPQPGGLLTLADIVDGSYAVTWIETTTGETLATGTAEARAGRLTLATPPVTRSAAAKLVRGQ
ncbi:MAG: DUF5060 domain-containing protein [Verrucomicrobia bacterium]|nr:DUF5060 domain-containing protein [Verrucomicrobiota bacterium]